MLSFFNIKNFTKGCFYKCSKKNTSNDVFLNSFATDQGSLLAVNFLINKKYKFWKYLSLFILLSLIAFWTLRCFYNSSDGYIARVSIDRVIVSDDEVFEALKQIKDDAKIKAVIFKINSPGGTITGSEMLYKSIKSISATKPTAALVYDIAASGAYMASIGTHYIVAQSTSMVGSVGVIMDYWNLEDAIKKLGLKKKTIKTSEFKAAPSMYSENSPEVEQYLNDLLLDGYEYFVSLVKQERGKKIANLVEVTSGKVFSGRQALNLGLIDEIGNTDTVVMFFEKQKKLTNASKLKIKDIEIKEDENQGFLGRAMSMVFGLFSKNLADNLFKGENFDNSSVNTLKAV
jgi:protease-4